MKRKLSTSVKTTVKVSQRITLVKYAVAGTLFVALLAGGFFIYLNIGDSKQAEAGNATQGENGITNLELRQLGIVDLSQLSFVELELLTNRNFEYDTTRKQYASVKWILDDSPEYLTLEITNSKSAYSLEIFDPKGLRVLNFVNLTEVKFSVRKDNLIPNIEYYYLLRNADGELYAGNLLFN